MNTRKIIIEWDRVVMNFLIYLLIPAIAGIMISAYANINLSEFGTVFWVGIALTVPFGLLYIFVLSYVFIQFVKEKIKKAQEKRLKHKTQNETLSKIATFFRDNWKKILVLLNLMLGLFAFGVLLSSEVYSISFWISSSLLFFVFGVSIILLIRETKSDWKSIVKISIVETESG